MSFTRFNYDECRTIKKLQQQTGPGRWIMNMPGNGSNMSFIEDPQIILQKWGANLRTNSINLESELLGMNKGLNKDCLSVDNYLNNNVNSSQIEYSVSDTMFTEESRAITPAWEVRETSINNMQYLHKNPQINALMPFANNISSRIVEKDNYKRDV